MKDIRKILVATDFSPSANEAVDAAIELARKFDAGLVLLHVHVLPTYYGYGEGLYFPIAELQQEAHKALEQEVARLTPKYPRLESAFRVGYPSNEIMDVVRERGCDLIVVGTHGRRGLEHVLLGSVAERVVRTAPVPVLTVGPRPQPARTRAEPVASAPSRA